MQIFSRQNKWYKYIQTRADGTSKYKPKPGLPLDIVMKLKPIFEELIHESLLEKCLCGETQNQNESFRLDP